VAVEGEEVDSFMICLEVEWLVQVVEAVEANDVLKILYIF
jgi:hypothetical protein